MKKNYNSTPYKIKMTEQVEVKFGEADFSSRNLSPNHI